MNFEDGDATSAVGAIQRQAAANLPTFGAAAAGTLGVYNQRAERKTKWYKAREAVSYSCQELIARDKNGTSFCRISARTSATCRSTESSSTRTTLTITSRYDNGSGNGPNYRFYHGALL